MTKISNEQRREQGPYALIGTQWQRKDEPDLALEVVEVHVLDEGLMQITFASIPDGDVSRKTTVNWDAFLEHYEIYEHPVEDPEFTRHLINITFDESVDGGIRVRVESEGLTLVNLLGILEYSKICVQNNTIHTPGSPDAYI